MFGKRKTQNFSYKIEFTPTYIGKHALEEIDNIFFVELLRATNKGIFSKENQNLLDYFVSREFELPQEKFNRLKKLKKKFEKRRKTHPEDFI